LGEEDEWWVAYGDDDELQMDGPRFRSGESHADEESRRRIW
jgi:hypothetical protein